MRQVDAQTMAIRLMGDHDLLRAGWSFDWMNAKKTNGICYFARKQIKLSRIFVDGNTEDRVRLTILHEIAHAKAGHKAGHGPEWRRICIAIGGDGQRCGESEAKVEFAWTGVCANGHSAGQHRAPLRVKACGRCSSVFRPENVIKWYRDGRAVPVAQMPVRYVREAMSLQAKYGNRVPV